MAWAGSNRRAELPPDWEARRKVCIDAAGGRCEARLPSGKRCPRPGTDVDHKSDPDNHDDLQLLCTAHHKRKTSDEAREGRRRGPVNRPTESRHPGRLTP